MGRWKMFAKQITIRVSDRQYDKYKKFCFKNSITLNELVRLCLDIATCGDEFDAEEFVKQWFMRMRTYLDEEYEE